MSVNAARATRVLQLITNGQQSGPAVAIVCFAESNSHLSMQCQGEACDGDPHLVGVWGCLERHGGSREEMKWYCLTRVESSWVEVELDNSS